MGRAEDIRNLCQDMVNSFDTRVARLKTLRHETAAMLKGFQHDRRQKAADLKRFLSNAETSRMSDFRAMHQGIRARQEERNRELASMMDGIRARQEERNGEVARMLGGFRRENEAAASQWRNLVATMAQKAR